MQVRSVGLVSRLLYTRHGGCVCAVQGLYVVYSFLDGNSKDAIPINLQDRGMLKLCTVVKRQGCYILPKRWIVNVFHLKGD